MSRVAFSGLAKQDLREIAAYIRSNNPAAARRVVSRIRETCRTTLAMFPEAGTMRDDVLPGLRCFSVENYVIYFHGRNPVVIVRVLHGAQDATPEMFQ